MEKRKHFPICIKQPKQCYIYSLSRLDKSSVLLALLMLRADEPGRRPSEQNYIKYFSPVGRDPSIVILDLRPGFYAIGAKLVFVAL